MIRPFLASSYSTWFYIVFINMQNEVELISTAADHVILSNAYLCFTCVSIHFPVLLPWYTFIRVRPALIT